MERRIWILSKNLHFAAHFQFFNYNIPNHFYEYILEVMNSFYAFIIIVLISLRTMQNSQKMHVDCILIMHRQKGSLFRTLASAGVVLEFA